VTYVSAGSTAHAPKREGVLLSGRRQAYAALTSLEL